MNKIIIMYPNQGLVLLIAVIFLLWNVLLISILRDKYVKTNEA